jgi:hypothetical protein
MPLPHCLRRELPQQPVERPRRQVWSRSNGQLCFRIRRTAGYLTMELPEVYLIAGGNAHTIQATVIVDGNAQSIEVQKNKWMSVGEGADPEGGPATLLEFRASA